MMNERRKVAQAAKRAEQGGKPAPASTPRSVLPPVSTDISIELTEGLTKLGAIMLVPAPVPGTYLLQTGEELALIVARMAERNPKLLAALQGSSNIMDYVALGAWGLGFAAAVGVQVGRVPADAPLARTTGITAIVNDLESSGVIQVDRGGPIEEHLVDQATFEIPTPPEPELVASA
jgi:hypothetical protein